MEFLPNRAIRVCPATHAEINCLSITACAFLAPSADTMHLQTTKGRDQANLAWAM